MMLKSKKGQTEDIFADLVIALILIGITMGLIAFQEKAAERSIKLKQTAETADFYAADMLAFLRSPVPASDLTVSGIKEITFGEILAIISDENKEQHSWAFSLLQGERRMGLNTCTEKFENMLAKHFKYAWHIAVYNENGRLVFWCSPKGVSLIGPHGVAAPLSQRGKQQGRLLKAKLPTQEGRTATVEMGVCP